jgi:hypothetical protein
VVVFVGFAFHGCFFKSICVVTSMVLDVYDSRTGLIRFMMQCLAW